MKRIDNYIIEKFKISKNIGEQESIEDLENKLYELLKKSGEVYLEDVFGARHKIEDEYGYKVISIYTTDDYIYVSFNTGKDYDEEHILDNFSDIFSIEQIKKFIDYLENSLK